jgi:beta-galactosidase
MGSIGEYNDLFDKYPSLLGGAVWEWQDQGIWNRRNTDHIILAYGGGFGEFPNDKYFIHKGVVAADRSLKPHYPEMKHVYQWIKITAEDIEKGQYRIRNNYQFVGLDWLNGIWTLSENGQEISKGVIKLPPIGPGEETVVTIPAGTLETKPGSEYFLRISFELAQDRLWAKKDFELVSEQFELPVELQAAIQNASISPLILKQTENEYQIIGSGFTIVFDKSTGTFSSLRTNTRELLLNGKGPQLHLWRAPHRNDDMWADVEWTKYSLRTLDWKVEELSASQNDPSSVLIKASLTGIGANNFSVSHNVSYTISGDGTIKAENSVFSNNPKLVVARMGVRLFLNKDFNQISYFGRGPMENYADRKRGFDVGIYQSTVQEQLTPYEKPMECGNHEDVRWAAVTTANGDGLRVQSDSTLLQVSVLPYSDEDMEKVEYRIDLPESSATVFCISHFTLGVGSASCGPRPLPQYLVYAAPTKFNYFLKI